MSDLTIRIARILDNALNDPGVIDNVDVAHLLIRELGMKQMILKMDDSLYRCYATDWIGTGSYEWPETNA